jgi:hemerythrin-like domain-containing protein
MEELEHENHIIERVVAAMAVLAEKLRSGKEVEARVLSDLVEFLQVFADDCHHGKEEHYLFPLLEKKN